MDGGQGHAALQLRPLAKGLGWQGPGRGWTYREEWGRVLETGREYLGER